MQCVLSPGMRAQITLVIPAQELNGNTSCAFNSLPSVSRRIPSLRILRANRLISIITIAIAAFRLGVISPALAGNYSDLAIQGYRWIVVDGPYACTAEQDVQSIVGHHTDEVELHMVESIRCYYLTPGTIAQVLKEDPAKGMAEIRIGSVTRSLWTYTRFLSKHPVHDTYGVIETPENSGLVQNLNSLLVPALPDSTYTGTRENGKP
jgi:hypothetical protein